MHRTIGYARVSKKEQAEDSHALEQQQNRLTGAGADDIFTDVQSGRSDDRTQFNRLMELVRSKQVDRVIVTRIDRIGRSLPSLAKVFKDFGDAQVQLVVLDGSIDLTTVGGRTQAGIMAVLAQMESEMISDRSRHGWNYLRQRKVAMNPPFGYRKVNERHELDHTPLLCLLERQQEVTRSQAARDLVDFFLEGRSLRQAIARFNRRYGIQQFNHSSTVSAGFEIKGLFQKSPSGLKRWLLNPVLRGHLAYFADTPERQETHYDTHPDQRLITDDEFAQIQEILALNRERKGYGVAAPVYPLSGLVRCGQCGSTCYSSKSKPKAREGYAYFHCRSAAVDACSMKNYIRMDLVEDKVIDALLERKDTIAALANTPPALPTDTPEIQNLRQQLAGLERLERLGPNPALDVAKQDIKNQIETQQRQLVDQVQHQSELSETLLTVADKRYWESLSDSEKRSIYRLLIDRVIVQPQPSQPIAMTGNRPKARQRSPLWDVQIFLKV
ncbi:recombinase family protein [Phormidium tenue FACHB-886]|nr:recombinase family protein [Phormidium tenue FACHB-886]